MFKKMAILIGIIAVVSNFYTGGWESWMILSIASGCILLTYCILTFRRWKYISELSPIANEWLKKHNYLYTMPTLDDDFSEAANKLGGAGIILAVIGCFKLFWWGILIGLVNYVLMEHISKMFHWTNFVLEYKDLVAHEEILNYLERKEEEGEELRELQKKLKQRKAA